MELNSISGDDATTSAESFSSIQILSKRHAKRYAGNCMGQKIREKEATLIPSL